MKDKKTIRTKIIGTLVSVFALVLCICGMSYPSEAAPKAETEHKTSYEAVNVSRHDTAKYPTESQEEPEQEPIEELIVSLAVIETPEPKVVAQSNATAPKPTQQVVETKAPEKEPAPVETNEPENKAGEPVVAAPEKTESTSPYDAIPLSAEMQKILFDSCDMFGVPYKIVLAVIETESDFNPNVRSGSCVGYMQINSCNLSWLRSKIGVTDLTDPGQNIKAGVYMLSYLHSKYSEWHPSLVAYNCGEGGANSGYFSKGVYTSSYSRTVMSRADRWGELF